MVDYKPWADLLRYPSSERFGHIPDWIAAIRTQTPALASQLEALEEFCNSHSGSELEEAFVRTFENNAERALEVGWHLHGENYARGVFMARMRGLLREHSIEETVELPDHISHVLEVLDKAEEELGSALAKGVLLPAVEKIREGFPDAKSPYLGVIQALLDHLNSAHGAAEECGTHE